MTPHTVIDKTIWLVETHFGQPLSLDDMAEHAGVSRSHLSRIFPLATGFSLSGYVRGRRLSEAPKALAGGAPDILSVALDAGYGSHEAFTAPSATSSARRRTRYAGGAPCRPSTWWSPSP